ncbi:hypothetical protein ABZ464_29330 [Streptomyces sp. NPDC005820]|uniref:hypothetical protein n=1 Tax=Streptomyces sp. NPDC005820 TaxID=3157069 RepID=UPI0033C0CE64
MDEPNTAVVTALRAGADACTAWQNSPRRQELALGMALFLDSIDAMSTREFHLAHHSAAE